MKEERFNQLLESIEEMKAYQCGEADVPAGRVHFVGEPDPREIRRRMGLSQEDFAYVLGINIKTLQNWEQGRREPTGPAMKLLQVAAAHPEVLLDLA